MRTRIANLSEVLLRYRVHSGQVGKTATEDQRGASDRIRAKLLLDAGYPASVEQIALHNRIAAHSFEPTREFVEKSEAWLLDLVQWSQREPDFDFTEMSRLAGHALYQICNYCCRWVDGLYSLWRRSALCMRLSLPEYFRFRMKTFLLPRR